MRVLTLRVKILLLATMPLIVVTLFTTVVAVVQANSNSEHRVETYREEIIASRKAELQRYTELALTAIQDIYETAGPDDARAKERAKAILRQLRYGDDGYFFVYDYDGVNLAHPILTHLEGKNIFDMRDIKGNPVIEKLIERARSGGGYYQYVWNKPSRGEVVDKLGYAVGLDKWQWMIGTGFYIDDIEEAVAKIRQEVTENLQQTLSFVVLFAAASVALIAVLAVMVNTTERRFADQQLKQLSQRIVDFQEEERRRVSRELHDGINQQLVSIQYQMETALEHIDDDVDRAHDAVDSGLAVLQQTVRDVRRISRDLRPGVLDDLGLSPALEALKREFSERTGVRIHGDTQQLPSRLRTDMETAVYRVVQEALTNVERHAGARNVYLDVNSDARSIQVTLRDDGNGFSPHELLEGIRRSEGLGLRNMRERIEFLGGRFRVASKRGGGTALEIEMPIAVTG